jgi:anti-anti-sigma regulatory factor
MSASNRRSMELDGVFDLNAARALDQAVDAVKRGGSLLVDFRRVRDFHDVGLAVLARTIQRSREDLELDVRGLRERQHRMLRYFGVELAGQGFLGDATSP